MKIKVVERGIVVECSGSVDDILEFARVMADKTPRMTIATMDGRAALCWRTKEDK